MDYSGMETIELVNTAKLDDNCLTVDHSALMLFLIEPRNVDHSSQHFNHDSKKHNPSESHLIFSFCRRKQALPNSLDSLISQIQSR
ncbi:hypothetical protein LWI29_008748 [Acer saccharum]|uniref:Uncharacterized protein n=1 Tax=Acer saccharum TaxID=4024 RepID=A0AA39SRL7_ACESA|nr:hypothetical protein LWI29_008748 [Acer saccharum]